MSLAKKTAGSLGTLLAFLFMATSPLTAATVNTSLDKSVRIDAQAKRPSPFSKMKNIWRPYGHPGLFVPRPASCPAEAGARSWRTPLKIENEDLGLAADMDLAMNEGGVGAVVWGQNGDVMAKRYYTCAEGAIPAGWQSTETLAPMECPSEGGSCVMNSNPRVAVDGLGNIFVAWNSDNTNNDLMVKRFDASTHSWSAAQDLNAANGYVGIPTLAANASGHAVIVWSSGDYTVMASRYTPGAGWSSGATLMAPTSNSVWGETVDINEAGDALVTWGRSHPDGGGVNAVWAAKSTIAGGWTAAQMVVGESERASWPDVGLDDAGNGLLVWMAEGAGQWDIRSSALPAGSAWTPPTSIDSSSSNATAPKMSFNRSGNAIAAWSQDDGGTGNIWVNLFDHASGWSGAVSVETLTGDFNFPESAMASNGSAFVIWTDGNYQGGPLWANRYASSTWSSPQRLDSPHGKCSSPEIATDSAGNAMAGWIQNESGDTFGPKYIYVSFYR